MGQLPLILMLIGGIISIASTIDYCEPRFCHSGIHIACGSNGTFAEICRSSAAMIDITDKLKTFIVNTHNEKRNFIAGGGDIQHRTACRMATIQWDDELAHLATYNAKKCVMELDHCHSTEEFKNPGQNLAWFTFSGVYNVEDMVVAALSMWYGEIRNSNMDFINSYPSDQNPPIGHFTTLVNENNIRVGCAASLYQKLGSTMKEYLLACNYAVSNIIGYPIYSACTYAGSLCSTGKNPAYPNLCSVSELYAINKGL